MNWSYIYSQKVGKRFTFRLHTTSERFWIPVSKHIPNFYRKWYPFRLDWLCWLAGYLKTTADLYNFLPNTVQVSTIIYRKDTTNRLSRLVAHLRIFRLFMKGICDANLLWPLTKTVQNWIVDQLLLATLR